jgi:dTDP-4-dehydrorhamnose reductase
MTEIAVTGYEGTIGRRLVKKGYTPLECNITDLEQTFDTVSQVNPDVIVHCAAMTSVAWCEESQKEAFLVNVNGTANVLESFAGKFIYPSTVHVFNGNKYFDYSEKHEPNAVNVYGLTKLAGEQVVRLWDNPYTIIRISRSFDYSFLESKLGYLDDTEDSIEMPTFIKRSFVHTDHLAEGIAHVAENDLDVDLLNISGIHTLSYYNFWIQVAKTFGIDEKRIIPRKKEIEDYPRPYRGGLNVRKAKKLGVPLNSATDGLNYIKEKM